MTTADKIAAALRPIAPEQKLGADDVPLFNQLAALWDARSNSPAPATGRVLSQAGVDLIKQFEGLELKAYPDPGTLIRALAEDAESGAERAWGLQLIRALVDEVRFRSTDGGSEVQLVVNADGAAED